MNTNQLTVKVHNHAEIRKFILDINHDQSLNNRNFNKLNGKIRQLFRVPGDVDLILQWKDSSDDLITFSTDEELFDAIKEAAPIGCDSTRRQLRLYIQNKQHFGIDHKKIESFDSNKEKPTVPQDPNHDSLPLFSLERTDDANKPSDDGDNETKQRTKKSDSFTLIEFDNEARNHEELNDTTREKKESLTNLESLSKDLPPKSVATHLGRFCDHCRTPIRGNRFSCCFCEDFDLCQNCFIKDIHNEHNMTVIRRPAPLAPYAECPISHGDSSIFTHDKPSLTEERNDDLVPDSAPSHTTQSFPSKSYEPSFHSSVNEDERRHLYPSVPRSDSQKSLLDDLDPVYKHAAIILEEMGYPFDEKLLHLIIENKGNVEEIINHLS